MSNSDQQKTPEQVQRELNIDSLAVGDRASIMVLGFAGAEALKKCGMAVMMLDAFGRVRLMAPEVVQVLSRPRLENHELDELDEMDAIRALTFQGDSDEDIAQYLHERTLQKAGS